MPIAVLLPLINTILQIILQAQISLNNAPAEYRENHFKRLDRWEAFWDKLAVPFYRLVEKEANESKPITVSSS
jgi:hypothetical protein